MMRIVAAIVIAGLFTAASAVADEAEQIATSKALEEVKAATPPDQVYDIFNRFCKANFGAKAEPLVRETFGEKLEFVADSLWVHTSERSASIGWMTNLPATVEISGAKSEAASGERPFYVHLWRLKDLEPGKPVEVTITCTDEFGTKASRKITVTPERPQGAIDFPGELVGPPYVIDKPGYYILNRDITAPRTAIKVTAEGVTLDLGGHTVIYGTETVPKEQFTDKWMSYFLKGSFGIKNVSGSKFRLLGGKVIQGPGDNRGNDESCGFNALYIRDCSDVELAGMEVDFWTPQSWGVRLRNCGDNVLLHHNVVRDRGTKMHNRHGSGCGALGMLGSKGENYVARYNLVSRTRQNGIRGDYAESHHNEVYVDSWSTNSFATSIRPGHLLHHNRIFGTGYHAIAVPWGDGVKVQDNFIHMAGINTGNTRWWEGFGDQNSMNGLRHTQWGGNKTPSTDSDYARNIVVITGRNGAQIRGVEFFSDTYIKGLTLRDSTIKVISLDKETTKAACVATQGLPKREGAQNPVFYRNCTFISNINILRLGDDYGVGSRHYFFGCKFIREGNDPRFHTIVAMGGYASREHRLVDCVFAGGATADDVDWGRTKAGTRNYTVEYTLTVKTAPGAEVVITDAKGVETVIKADDKGIAATPLVDYRMSHAGKEMLTPHTVKAAGKTATVTMDAPKGIDLRQEPQGAAVPRNVYIVPTHPKFAFRKDDLAELRKRCLTTHAREYAVLKASSDMAAFLGVKPVAPGLLWQLTGESRYLRYAESDYDAFYEALDPKRTAALANDILYAIRRQTTIDGNIGRTIKGGDGTGFTTHSLQVAHYRTALLPIIGDDVPIALPGEMEKRARWTATRVDELRQIYNTVAYRRGGKATSFHCACFYGRVPEFFEAWRVVTGENYFGDPLLAGFILEPMHNTLPLDHSCAAMTNSWGHDHLGRPADYILASRSRDGLCQWVIHNPEWVTRRKVGKPDPADFDALGRAWEAAIAGLGGYKENQWNGPVAYWAGHMPSRILYYDPGLKEVAPQELPTDALFEGLGIVCMRSSWDDDAVFARLHSGPNFRGEPPHLNDNTFIIYHKGYLVRPEGSTDKLTSFANSVLVKDPDEKIIITGNYTGGVDWNALWDGKLSSLQESKINDGGQSYWKDQVERLNTKVRGKITAYEAGERFTYAVGDATQSYNPAKLKGFTRQFLYLKPGLVIVFDRVDSTKAEFEKRWVLHTKGEPRATDDAGVFVADAVSTAAWSTRGYSRTPGFEVPTVQEGPPRKFTLQFETAWDGMDVGIACKTGPKSGKMKWSLDGGAQKGELDQHSDEEKSVISTTLATAIPKGSHTLVIEEAEGKINFAHYTVRMGGRLFARTLLPEKFKRETTPNLQAKRDPFDRKADWRIDVVPEEARTDDVFLHVLEATDVSHEKPLDVKVAKGDDKVVMSFNYDGGNYEVTFNRTGEVNGRLKIRDTGGAMLVDKPLPAGIVDGPDPLIERSRRLMKEDPDYDYTVADIAGLTTKAEPAKLIGALADKRWHVRFYAARALGMKRERAASGLLIARLSDGDERVAGAAAEALGRLGAVEAVAPLVAALASEKSELKLYAASALGELGARQSAVALAKLLADENDFVSAAAAEALARLKAPEAADALSKAIDGGRAPHMKASYLWALSVVGDDTAKTRLDAFASSEDKTLRACAIAGLAQMPGNDAAPVLKAALKDEDKHIRGFAQRKLAALGDESALKEYVLAAGNAKQPFAARTSAIVALADCGYQKAVPDLVKLLDDQEKQGKSDTVAAHAALALYKLGDARGAEYLKSALMSGADKSKMHIAQSAAAALGSVEEKTSVPILMAGLLLKEMWWEVKPMIVESLFNATGIDPAAEVQYLDWNRFNRDAEAWKTWWEENKARYAEYHSGPGRGSLRRSVAWGSCGAKMDWPAGHGATESFKTLEIDPPPRILLFDYVVSVAESLFPRKDSHKVLQESDASVSSSGIDFNKKEDIGCVRSAMRC